MVGYGLCHGGPLFCRWGAVRFTGSTGKYVIVRMRDGALATTFTVGKATIHTFDTREEAEAFFFAHRAVRKRGGTGLVATSAAIVKLWRIDYRTVSPERSSAFVETPRHAGLRQFHFRPPQRLLAAKHSEFRQSV